MRFAKALAIPVALLAGACQDRDAALVRVLIISAGEPVPPARGKPPPVPELTAAIGEGLVGFDEQGRVVPAIADRWIVTEDGLSYIFRLRSGPWTGARPISSEAVATALRRKLRTLRRTPLGLDLAAIGEVRPMAARVIELRLDRPVPDLLTLLAQPELGLISDGSGGGPMRLEQHGAISQLEPVGPEQRGQPQEQGWRDRVRILRVRVEPAAAAVQRFDQGFADVVLGGRTDTLPLARTAGLSRGTVRLDPVTGLFGLLVLNEEGFFATAGNREAVAMAIDREALLVRFNVAGWLPTSGLVGSAIDAEPAAGERWTEFPRAELQQIARGRVDQWRAAGNELSPLRVALPESPGGDIIHARLQADLAAIGLAVERVPLGSKADLRLIDRVARYARAEWFLHQLGCAAGTPVCSKEGDDLLAAAVAAPQAEERWRLTREAEARITAANGFIPFARPLRWSLVRADVTGFAVNPWAIHPLLPLSLAPR